MASFTATNLRDVFQEAIDRFNGANNGGVADYDSLGQLFDGTVQMAEVDAPGKMHTNKSAVVSYLKNYQASKQPRFKAPQNGWNLAGENSTTGIITGSGQYQDKSPQGKEPPTDFQDVLYSFVFGRTDNTKPWLLQLGFASLVKQ